MSKKIFIVPAFLVFVLLVTGCLTMYEMHPVPPPWTVENASNAENRIRPPRGEVTPIYWVEEKVEIDGDFSEWAGLEGPVARVVVYGGMHDPADAEAKFVVKTDGKNLFIYGKATDDTPNENKLPASMAWKGDSIEVYIGSNTSSHKAYALGDNQIRLVPVSRDDMFNFELSINDVAKTKKTEAAVVFSDTGYEIEASIPLALLQIDGLEPGQKVKCEFIINDADEQERDRSVHWMSPTDDAYKDASVWGKGLVTEKVEE